MKLNEAIQLTEITDYQRKAKTGVFQSPMKKIEEIVNEEIGYIDYNYIEPLQDQYQTLQEMSGNRAQRFDLQMPDGFMKMYKQISSHPRATSNVRPEAILNEIEQYASERNRPIQIIAKTMIEAMDFMIDMMDDGSKDRVPDTNSRRDANIFSRGGDKVFIAKKGDMPGLEFVLDGQTFARVFHVQRSGKFSVTVEGGMQQEMLYAEEFINEIMEQMEIGSRDIKNMAMETINMGHEYNMMMRALREGIY